MPGAVPPACLPCRIAKSGEPSEENTATRTVGSDESKDGEGRDDAGGYSHEDLAVGVGRDDGCSWSVSAVGDVVGCCGGWVGGMFGRKVDMVRVTTVWWMSRCASYRIVDALIHEPVSSFEGGMSVRRPSGQEEGAVNRRRGPRGAREGREGKGGGGR